MWQLSRSNKEAALEVGQPCLDSTSKRQKKMKKDRKTQDKLYKKNNIKLRILTDPERCYIELHRTVLFSWLPINQHLLIKK